MRRLARLLLAPPLSSTARSSSSTGARSAPEGDGGSALGGLVQNVARQEGTAAWDGTRMVGTADALVPTGEPGVPLDGSLLFVFRTYLEPGRTVRPDASEVLVERVWHFTKR